MIEVEISAQMITQAKERFDQIKFGELKDNHRFGSNKLRVKYGYLGEEMVFDHLGIMRRESYDYDCYYKDMRTDIKTISCKFKPQDHYLVTINSPDPVNFKHQDNDVYIFTRVLNNGSKGWILGYMPSDEFVERGDKHEKGDEVAGMKFIRTGGITMAIEDLYKF